MQKRLAFMFMVYDNKLLSVLVESLLDLVVCVFFSFYVTYNKVNGFVFI